MLERARHGLGPLRGPLRAAGGAVVGAEVGGAQRLLGRRVLGQYELRLLDPEYPPRLLFVAPNLRRGGAARWTPTSTSCCHWVAFHEVTHAVQFSGVPGCAPTSRRCCASCSTALELQVDLERAVGCPRRDDLRALADRLREGGLVGAVAGPERRAIARPHPGRRWR